MDILVDIVMAMTALEFGLGFPVLARYMEALATALRGIRGIYQDHPYPLASALYRTNCFSSSKLHLGNMAGCSFLTLIR